jgi:hypothetical protein
MDEGVSTPAIWIRAEDADHPRLERLRRAVTVDIGPEAEVSEPWLVWGAGLSHSWLAAKLEAGAQALILPPWPEGGFAGLPVVRTVTTPSSSLLLRGNAYAVGAIFAMEPTPAWQEHGLFTSTKLAWLVAHEPFVGAGKAWLCTAELLVASPTTRPREARRLIMDLVAYLRDQCRTREIVHTFEADESEQPSGGFSREDVPYLLAVLGLPDATDVERTAQFVHRRLGVEPDMDSVQRVLSHQDVQAALTQPLGARTQLAKIVDDLGFRSYRLEIEETAL